MAVTVRGFKERQTAGETCKSNGVCEARTQSNCAREENGPQSAGGGGEGEQERAQAQRGRRETKLGARSTQDSLDTVTGYRGRLSLETRCSGGVSAGRHEVMFSLTLSSRGTRNGAFGR